MMEVKKKSPTFAARFAASVRIPFAVFGLGFVVLTLGTTSSLVAILDGLIYEEATKTASVSVRSTVAGVAARIARPFYGISTFGRVHGGTTLATRDFIDDGRSTVHQSESMLQRMGASIVASPLLLFGIYSFVYVERENMWAYTGCTTNGGHGYKHPHCDIFVGPQARVPITPFEYPGLSLRKTGYFNHDSRNLTGNPYMHVLKEVTTANRDGVWSEPTIFSYADGRNVLSMSFSMPVRFNLDGSANLFDRLDVRVSVIQDLLVELREEKQEIILFHPASLKIIATTYDIPLFETEPLPVTPSPTPSPPTPRTSLFMRPFGAGNPTSLGAGSVPAQPRPNVRVWTSRSVPNTIVRSVLAQVQAERHLACDHPEVLESADENHFLGIAPVRGGQLNLTVITVTERSQHYAAAQTSRLYTILVGGFAGFLCSGSVAAVCIIIHIALWHLKRGVLAVGKLHFDNDDLQARSCIVEAAELQSHFAGMNEVLREAGAYIPQAVKAEWNAQADALAHNADQNGKYRSGDNGDGSSFAGVGRGFRCAMYRQLTAELKPQSYRFVAVLDLNIVGFHRITQPLPFATVAEVLDKLTAAVVSAADASGGVLDAFQGDRFTVTFNAVTAVEDPEHRAVACAAAVRIAAGLIHVTPPPPRQPPRVSRPEPASTRPTVVTLLTESDLSTASGDARDLEAVAPSSAEGPPTTTTLATHSSNSNTSHTNADSPSNSVLSAATPAVPPTPRRNDPSPEALVVTSGVAAGLAQVGSIGSSAMRKMGVIGSVVARASVLERLCRGYASGGLWCTVTEPSFAALEKRGVRLSCVDFVRLPGDDAAGLVGAVTSSARAVAEATVAAPWPAPAPVDESWLFAVPACGLIPAACEDDDEDGYSNGEKHDGRFSTAQEDACKEDGGEMQPMPSRKPKPAPKPKVLPSDAATSVLAQRLLEAAGVLVDQQDVSEGIAFTPWSDTGSDSASIKPSTSNRTFDGTGKSIVDIFAPVECSAMGRGACRDQFEVTDEMRVASEVSETSRVVLIAQHSAVPNGHLVAHGRDLGEFF